MTDNHATGPEEKQKQELMGALQQLFVTGKYTDFSIICGTDEYRVHKSVICPRSSFFEAAFANELKENRTNTVNLSEDDPSAVKSMVHFFYHLDYPHVEYQVALTEKEADQPEAATPPGSPEPASPAPRVPNLLLHSRVYNMAERLGVDGLKDLARRKFVAEVTEFWKHEELVDAAWDIYGGTIDEDRGLRDVVVKTLMKHLKLMKQDNWTAILENTKLASDVLHAIDFGYETLDCGKCPLADSNRHCRNCGVKLLPRK